MTGQFSRVTVAIPAHQVDLMLPADLPVGKLIDFLAVPGQQRPGSWVLTQDESGPVAPHITLAEAGILDGAVLYLREQSAGGSAAATAPVSVPAPTPEHTTAAQWQTAPVADSTAWGPPSPPAPVTPPAADPRLAAPEHRGWAPAVPAQRTSPPPTSVPTPQRSDEGTRPEPRRPKAERRLVWATLTALPTVAAGPVLVWLLGSSRTVALALAAMLVLVTVGAVVSDVRGRRGAGDGLRVGASALGACYGFLGAAVVGYEVPQQALFAAVGVVVVTLVVWLWQPRARR